MGEGPSGAVVGTQAIDHDPDADPLGGSRPAHPLWSRPRQLRLFSSTRRAPRSRRATDVLLLLAAVAGLALLEPAAESPGAVERALVDLARALPGTLSFLWEGASNLLLIWAGLLMLGALLGRRLTLLRDLVLGVAGALAIDAAIEALVQGAWPHLLDSLTASGPPSSAGSVRMAAATAAATIASPHLSRPFRTLGRWILAVGAVALVVLEVTGPTGVAIGFLAGVAVAAVIHLALGSSAGRPALDEVGQALRELGVDAVTIHEAARQTAGLYQVDAVDSSGQDLLVKVYGRDAWDTQLLAKAWRALWYRRSSALTLTRLQQAEHEGFVTLMAAHHGVPVAEVVRAGRTAANDAIIVLRRSPTTLADLPTGEVDEALVAQAWDAVTTLQDAAIAHGDLAPDRFRLEDGRVVLTDFEGATAAPDGDQRRADLAQLVVATMVMVGVERGTAIALERLGPEGLADVLPYLQVAALGQHLRDGVRRAGLDLDDLRSSTSEAAGVEAPPMAKLRRVSRGTLIRTAVLAVAAYFLISSLAGLDWADLQSQFQDAIYWLMAVGLVMGQTPRFAQAISTRGASPRPLPYGPVAALQFAITFINLVLPSTAARVALNVRFFQRQGIPPASAVSIGAVDGFGGFVVQVMILVTVLLLGVGSPDLDFDTSSDTGAKLITLLLALLAVVLLALVGAALVPKLRHKVIDRVKPWLGEIRETLASLRSPSKVAQILGGNLLSEVLFAVTLGIFLAAYHVHLSLPELLVINVVASLFAGLMPVPGGVGVTEGAIIAGLTAAGVDQATAFAATISYRLATFYLPPIWGAGAFHWLERNRFL